MKATRSGRRAGWTCWFELAPAFVEGIREQHRKVKNVMTSGVTTVTEEMPARDVAHLMYTKNIKRVPVLRDGKLVGIVARSDLVRALAQKLEEKPPAQSTRLETLNEALRHRREEGDR
jgi:signal-transduction protein with cAMP-binding, CBS, and nucleotidyltransferase domain